MKKYDRHVDQRVGSDFPAAATDRPWLNRLRGLPRHRYKPVRRASPTNANARSRAAIPLPCSARTVSQVIPGRSIKT